MNDIFSFKRFFYLLKKQLFEKRLFLLGFSIIVVFAEILVYKGNGNIYQDSLQLQLLSLFILLVLSPTILISFMLNSFSDKKKTIATLLLPVSFLEKWALIGVVAFCVFLPIHLVILKCVDYSFVNYYKELALESQSFSLKVINQKWTYLTISPRYRPVFIAYLIVSAYVSAIFMLGSLYFKSQSYFKTALVLIMILAAIVFGGNFITRTIIGEDCHLQFADFGAWINVKPRPFMISGTSFSANTLTWFVKLILPVSIWLIAILRFKEKEI